MFGSNQTPGSGFTFGAGGAAGSTSTGGGFSFGGTKPAGTAAATPAATGFGGKLTGTATATPAAGGFGVGATASNPQTTTADAGFNFGASAQKPNPFGGFNFTGTLPTQSALAAKGVIRSAGTTPGAASGFSLGTGGTGTTGGFSLGGATTTPAPTPAAGFSLSTPAATTAATSGFTAGGTTAPTAGFSLAGVTSAPAASGFSLSSTAPAGGFSLGGTNTNSSSSSGASIFGAKPTASAAPATTSAPSLGGFSGFGATAAAPASSAGGSSLLGGLLNSQTNTATSLAPPAASSALGTATTTTAAAAAAGFTGFGTTTSSAASTGFNFSTPAASTSAQTLGGFSLASAKPSALPTSTSSGLAAAGAGLGGVAAASHGKSMTFRQLEETIGKWTTELEEQERCFLEQATQVNAWDRLIMENGDRIVQLNTDVEQVKLDQQKLDHELDFVHSQQRELEDLLVPLEKALAGIGPVSYQQHADVEREHTYMLAENLDAQLKRMSQDLKEIIERLNSTSSKPDENDPVQQITKILNAHVVSLMWVDRNSANLQRRVQDISKQMDLEKREQEKNFRLAYS